MEKGIGDGECLKISTIFLHVKSESERKFIFTPCEIRKTIVGAELRRSSLPGAGVLAQAIRPRRRVFQMTFSRTSNETYRPDVRRF